METHGKNGLKLAKHCSNKKAKDISSNNWAERIYDKNKKKESVVLKAKG